MRWVDAEIIGQPSGSLALTLREAGSGKVVARGDGTSLSLSFEPKLWDEFTPNLYRLDVALGEYRHEIAFGFRTTSRDSHRLLINGRPTFLRGTSALLLSAFCLCSAVALGGFARLLKVRGSDLGVCHKPIEYNSPFPPPSG